MTITLHAAADLAAAETSRVYPDGLATVDGTVVSVGTRARHDIHGPHRHTSDGVIAESVLAPVTAADAERLIADGYRDLRTARKLKITVKGQTFATDAWGQGVFALRGGAYVQHRQAGPFTSEAAFRRYVQRMLRGER